MPQPVVSEHLHHYAAELGFGVLPGFLLRDSKFVSRLRDLPNDTIMQKLANAFARELIPYALVAAADADSPHRAVHPLRGLASRRPALLTELFDMPDRLQLSELRNRGSHADRDASISADIVWCRELALDAARTVLEMAPQPQQRISV